MENKDNINELWQRIYFNILQIEEQYLNKNEINVSLKEVHVLDAINKNPEKPMSSIAKYLNVTVGTLTTSIDHLVKKGLVIRANDPTDKRKVFLELSSSGYAIIDNHNEFHNMLIDSILKNTTVLEQKTLLNSLENVIESLKIQK